MRSRSLQPGRTILLFYADFERDRFVRSDRYLKRMARPLYARFASKPPRSGFRLWFDLLASSLEAAGYDVRVNDENTALRHPGYPVGLAGYPQVLQRWGHLPNPAILGPGLFDHPAQAPTLLDDPRFRRYVVTCAWVRDMFAPVYGAARCLDWHAGFDLTGLADFSSAPKTVDFLVYDKIRWNRDLLISSMLQRILDALDARALRHEYIRYGRYHPADYRGMLKHARAMIFLCEHETQGMAYQEALACGIPVLAWDNGAWLDPRAPGYDPRPIRASSVPYFSPECGERFRCGDEFEPTLERFLLGLDSYQPRAYVASELSPTQSAEVFARGYFGVLQEDEVTTVTEDPTLSYPVGESAARVDRRNTAG